MTWGLTHVDVAYGPAVALRDFTVELRSGEVTALVGGDGAGKTTALRALVGVAAPSSGEVRRPDARGIGYVSAGPGLYGDLSVDENLSFAGIAYGIPRAERARRAESLLERTALKDARNRLAANLSGGMRQKLALAVALIHAPGLLVLDEPTTGVDPVSRSELWRLIARAASDGAAVVLATSYIDEAERASQVLVLSDGETLASGMPDDIVAAMPGAFFVAPQRPPRVPSWRRGPQWRVWSPDGSAISGARSTSPDLEDAVMVAELRRPAATHRGEMVTV